MAQLSASSSSQPPITDPKQLYPNNNTNAGSKSFVAIVASNQSPKIPVKLQSTYKGEPTILFFPKDGIQELTMCFKHIIIGKFSHGRHSLSIIKKAYNVSLIDNKHIIIIKLNHEEEFLWVWMQDQWFTRGFPMLTFKCLDISDTILKLVLTMFRLIFLIFLFFFFRIIFLFYHVNNW